MVQVLDMVQVQFFFNILLKDTVESSFQQYVTEESYFFLHWYYYHCDVGLWRKSIPSLHLHYFKVKRNHSQKKKGDCSCWILFLQMLVAWVPRWPVAIKIKCSWYIGCLYVNVSVTKPWPSGRISDRSDSQSFDTSRGCWSLPIRPVPHPFLLANHYEGLLYWPERMGKKGWASFRVFFMFSSLCFLASLLRSINEWCQKKKSPSNTVKELDLCWFQAYWNYFLLT